VTATGVVAPRFTTLTARTVALPRNDIDTDQIIPARFLKVTDKLGLGQKLFCDWRYLENGSDNPDFPLNRPDAQGAQVLIAGVNFGCGSSREHAPWALVGWGLKAVVAISFADIFKGNALKNGLIPIAIEPAEHAALLAARAKNPALEVTVDLEKQTLTWPGQSGPGAAFPVDAFSKKCLLQGVDELGYLLGFSKQVEAYEQRHR
jgi:3-isopropylmalate/(R)-2-methylmalate dehydratase small subunit